MAIDESNRLSARPRGGNRRVQPAGRPVREPDELCKLSSGCKTTPSLSIVDMML